MGKGKGDAAPEEIVSVEWDAGTPDRAFVRLAGDLTIGTVEAVHGVLPGVLLKAGSVAVDAGHLRSIDLSGLQLLIAGRRSAENAGKLFYLTAPADGALRRSLVAAGLVAAGDDAGSDDGDDGWVDAFWLAG
ncbi:MAG: STAS domain-containing protein [Alphaproteobacteria bacterium]|nr:STAS domain-containing protein [Alphaproteobacteria bacterium]